MTYSLDFRENVLRHIDQGGRLEAVSRLFSVGTTIIKNWKRLRAETGKLEGSGRPCNPYKIDAKALKLYIEKRPDAFLNEIASHFGVTAPAIHTARNNGCNHSPQSAPSGRIAVMRRSVYIVMH